MIVRHGESHGNCDKSVNCYTPNHKVPLTNVGHEQAIAAGLKLREYVGENESICFYTSPYLRTRQTLQGIIKGMNNSNNDKSNKGNIDYIVHEEPRMREQDFGNFQGTSQEMKKILAERAKYGHFFYRIPHGESAADVYDRCSSFNDSLFRQFKRDDFPEILVLVTHGIWARVFLQRWFRWSVEYFEDLTNIPHCQWIQLELSHSQIYDEKKPHDESECPYILNTDLERWSTLKGGSKTDFFVYPY